MRSGPCVDFIAPGHEIVSAGIDSKSDYESRNGTSMATPHVAGLSALVLAEHPELLHERRTVRDKLYETLVTSRSANVSNFLMPLMETGCEEGAPRMARRSNNNQFEPVGPVFVGPVPVTALLSASSSPSATPSSSPFPSASPSPSPSPSKTPQLETTVGDKHDEGKMEEDNFDRLSPPAGDSYYQFGFGPADNPYEYGTVDDKQ